MSTIAFNHGCLRQWLSDIRSNAALECMCVLQGKSITDEITVNVSNKEFIKNFCLKAIRLSRSFNKLIKKLSQKKWTSMPIALLRIIKEVKLIIEEGQVGDKLKKDGIKMIEKEITKHAIQLISLTDKEQNNSSNEGLLSLESQVILLHGHFNQWLNSVIISDVEILMKVLSSSTDSTQLMDAADSIICLCLDDERACSAVLKNDGVRLLLLHCQSSEPSFSFDVCAHMLRAIATICTLPESINQFQKINGFQEMVHLLSRYEFSEALRAEAAGVIAQVTSPSLTSSVTLVLIDTLEELVSSVTMLCSQATCADVLLLATASLANLCLTDSMTCEYIFHFNTVPILLKACSKFTSPTMLFVCDQIVTIIYSLLNLESYKSELTEINVVKFLSSVINENAAQYKDVEFSVYDRIVKKAELTLFKYNSVIFGKHD